MCWSTVYTNNLTKISQNLIFLHKIRTNVGNNGLMFLLDKGADIFVVPKKISA